MDISKQLFNYSSSDQQVGSINQITLLVIVLAIGSKYLNIHTMFLAPGLDLKLN